MDHCGDLLIFEDSPETHIQFQGQVIPQNLTRHMYSDGSGWGAEAGGIFGFSCFTWSKVYCCLGKNHGLNWKATFFYFFINIIKQSTHPLLFCRTRLWNRLCSSIVPLHTDAVKKIEDGSFHEVLCDYLTCPLLLDLSNINVSLLRNKSFSNKTIASLICNPIKKHSKQD